MPKPAPVDLNLIRSFVAIYETRSLTAAAARLYVTQPAVSQALARLRRDLNDPLFRRVGREMQPSPLAVSIFPGFRDAIAGIDRTIDGVAGFDPAASTRRSRIALSELGEIGYFPAIFRAVRASAPHLRIESVPLDVHALPEWLSQGTIDLAVTSSPVAGGFPHTVLKSQAYAVLMSRDHRFADAAHGVTLEDYVAADQVIVSGDSGLPRLESALRRAGAALRSDVVLEPLRVAAVAAGRESRADRHRPRHDRDRVGAELAARRPAAPPRDAAGRGLPVPPHHDAAARRARLALRHRRPGGARHAWRVLRDPRRPARSRRRITPAFRRAESLAFRLCSA